MDQPTVNLSPEDIRAIAKALAEELRKDAGVQQDAAYLASLSKEDYDQLMKPRMRRKHVATS